MVDRPILFSAPMVRALLAGRKTQTRRIMPNHDAIAQHAEGFTPIIIGRRVYDYAGEEVLSEALFAVGDRLWVKETWRAGTSWDDNKPSMIAAHVPVDYVASPRSGGPDGKARPSIFMPRWASRLTLTVTDVRVQRLQEISEEDAIAEGVETHDGADGPVAEYEALWESINGAGSWEANPWVVAVSFSCERRNIDA